jgi:quercetin dioxygenase-like cupin family protein
MKKLIAVLACAVAAPLLAMPQEPQPAASPAAKQAPAAREAPAITMSPAAELKWTDSPVVKGGRVAVLWGNPEKEGYGRLNRWPGGSEVALHYHPFEVHGVVLEGTITLTPDGGTARELGPGSYWHIPGRVPHITTCKPGADCLFLVTSKLRHEVRMGKPRS